MDLLYVYKMKNPICFVSILLLICCMFYKTEVAVHFVMCFPDVYEIGMSQGLFYTSINFGLLLTLYVAVRILAERFYFTGKQFPVK